MHLYVHIPFCHRICPYCSFYKHTPASTDMNLFVRALLREVESRKDDLQNSPEHEPRTLYFGGGTPSMLSNSHLGKIIQGIDHVVDIASLDEFSFESNPTTFTINKVRAWKDMGINRVSLGIQSWDPRILAVLGRTHTPEIALHSLEMLRTAGISEINIDLMFAIPGQTLQLWEQTLLQTVEANPEHISAYNLTYEEDTAFFESLAKGEINQDTEHDADYFELADTILTDAGFRHYETSNYARNNLLSKHNFGYWQGDDYIGIGPGAVSTIRGSRIQNTMDTNAYIRSTLEHGVPDSETERLREEDILLERVALLLRTDTGVPMKWVPPRTEAFITNLIDENMAIILHSASEDSLDLKGKGRLLVDEIVTDLFSIK